MFNLTILSVCGILLRTFWRIVGLIVLLAALFTCTALGIYVVVTIRNIIGS